MPFAASDRLPDPALNTALDALVHARSTAFVPKLAAKFLTSLLPPGNFFVYPAGQEAAELIGVLDRIAGEGGLQITGVVDRDAPEGRTLLGRPVTAPATLSGDERVLVCHSVREAELLEVLRNAGIEEDRIIPVFGHPGYSALSRSKASCDLLLDNLPRNDGGSPRYLIVRAERSGQIIDESVLATVLPPEDTLVLNVATPAERVASGVYRVVDLYRSLALLQSALERSKPDLVYLQLNLHTVYLGALVRRILPQTTLVYEMWDLWRASIGDLRPEDYGSLLGMSEDMVTLNRLCEPYLLNTADLLISKRGGTVWKNECREFKAPCQQYFVRIGEVEDRDRFRQANPPAKEGLRILFAATFQKPETLAEFDYIRPNQDHHAVFAALTADGRTSVDLYNAAHRDRSLDPLYIGYIERYRDGPIRYHRRVPPEQLLAEMDGFDYGWIRATPAVPSVDCHVVIPASLSSYIAGGLPVIVHATLTYASALISRFDAGIVVPEEEKGDAAVQRVLSEADPARHRTGAMRLRAYMMERNRKLLEKLRRYSQGAENDFGIGTPEIRGEGKERIR